MKKYCTDFNDVCVIAGPEVIEHAGGLHKFIKRNRPIITDSGGFQVGLHPVFSSGFHILFSVLVCLFHCPFLSLLQALVLGILPYETRRRRGETPTPARQG